MYNHSAPGQQWQPNHTAGRSNGAMAPAVAGASRQGYGDVGQHQRGGNGTQGARGNADDDEESDTESEDEEALQAKQKAFAQRHRPPPKKRPATSEFALRSGCW
jgi:hypothetical protein